MTVHAYRSQRVEELVDALERVLSASWPDDPFESVPIVVGSRGMERWLRHELATRLGGLARVDFLFPGTVFDGAARWLLGAPSPSDRTAFWERTSSAGDGWSGASLRTRVLSLVRARLEQPRFARIRAYLGKIGENVGARELAFAEEVSGTIERMLYDRPDDALAWAADPTTADEAHAWLAEVLRDLHADLAEPGPARRLAELQRLARVHTSRPLFVFCLSTLRPGDKVRLAALAQHLELHLFALSPSSEWWDDIRRASAQRAALREAKSPKQVASLLAELDRQNALLAANGEPSRDLQLWLETLGYDEPRPALPLAPADSLLGRLHEWIDRAADNPRAATPSEAPWRSWASCPSVEVHACHDPLRQCEALRDELLRRFAKDATLEPRHVLVMTPDVETYAPLLAAVFARRSGAAPPLPVHIADLGIRATNPVADALLQILGLADERVTASRLLEILGNEPVRACLRLAADDLADLRTMVVESGIRWAWDSADRERHEQPKLDQSTVRFGLERLALGVLMHDPGGLGVVPALHGDGLGPAVPVEIATRERVERFGRLAEGCSKLLEVRERVAEPANGGVWRKRLLALLDELTLVEDSAAWLRGQVDDTLEELLPDEVGEALRLDRTAVVALLRGAFELPQGGDRPVTGGVTVCALEPMRSVPFRVIAMLGLDDGAFPRAGRTPAWDPFATPKPGEHDRRTIDRHLFLEAMLCARDALLLFGNGFEPKRGKAVPLSIVASELLEVVAAGVGAAPDTLLRRHPLQPWSEQAFAAEGRLPFDSMWVDAAMALRGERKEAGLAATRLEAIWPTEEHPPLALTADDLASALAKPQEALLKKRLGLALEAEDTSVSDREALEQGGLETWAIRDRVLQASIDGALPDVEAIEARLRGEGELPLEAAGRRALEACLRDAGEVLRRASEVPGSKSEPLQVSCDVDGLLVTAVATDVRTDGADRRLVWMTPSKGPNARLQLVAWITLLVAVVGGTDVRAAHLVGCGTSLELRATADCARALEHLSALVKMWRRVRGGPVPLFPKLSRALVGCALADPTAEPASLLHRAEAAWEGTMIEQGDRYDPWVSSLFGHLTVDDLADRAKVVVDEASLVWQPLLGAIPSKPKAKTATPAASKGGLT